MTVQKSIDYTPLDIKGNRLKSTYKLNLYVSKNTSNYLVHKDLLRHQNLQRQGTASTKTRSEVRGGGRKPWRQKGTGRARAGSSRSPLWKNGGVIFGPKPKQINIKVNKKERKLALQILLYNKRNNTQVIENLEQDFLEFKTNSFITLCKTLSIDLNKKLLLIVKKKTQTLKLATHNLKNVELISSSTLNTVNLLKANSIILSSSALKDLKEVYHE